MKFKKTTNDLLENLGWTDDRRINASPFIQCLIGDGYQIFPVAETFLESFGGLDGFMPAYRIKGKLERIHFNPQIAIAEIYRERVATYEARTGEQLLVVGSAYSAHMSLLLSPTGRMFGAYDDYLCLLGNSVEQGITTLFENLNAPEVP